MNHQEFFEAAVAFHIIANYVSSEPYINKGKHAPVNGNEIIPGKTENKLSNGLLAVLNGSKTLDTLIQERVVPEEDRQTQKTSTPDFSSVVSYMEENASHDGAHVINSKENYIQPISILSSAAVVHMLNNGIRFENIAPKDFCSADYSVPVDRKKLGTRTQVALSLPQVFPNLATILIRTTAHSPMGLGPVAYVTKNGVERIVVPAYEPNSKGPFLDESKGIVLIDKKYEKRGDILVPVSREYFDPARIQEPMLKYA